MFLALRNNITIQESITEIWLQKTVMYKRKNECIVTMNMMYKYGKNITNIYIII